MQEQRQVAQKRYDERLCIVPEEKEQAVYYLFAGIV
jgi:hypothetical protein